MQKEHYLVMRWLGFIIQGLILAYSIYLEVIEHAGLQSLVWFAYLTHVNLLLTFSYEAIMLYAVTKQHNYHSEIYSVLRDTAITMSIAVVILYWALDRSSTLFQGILFHGVSTLCLLIEVIVIRQSYVPRLFSWRYFTAIIVSVIYINIEALLTLHGVTNHHGKPLYHALPWKTDFATAMQWSIVGIILVAAIPLLIRKLFKTFNKTAFPL